MVAIKYMNLPSFFLLSVCLFSGSASAATSIDFDDGISAGDPIGNFYSDLGITFLNAEWSDRFNGRPGTSSPFRLSSVDSGNQPKVSSPIIGIFSSPVDMVSISAIDVGFNDARIDVYDAINGGNLLGFDLYEGVSPLGNTFNPQDTEILSVSASGIMRFELYQPKSEVRNDGVAWDNLTYNPMTPVPEPSTSLLALGSILAGMLGARLWWKK